MLSLEVSLEVFEVLREAKIIGIKKRNKEPSMI